MTRIVHLFILCILSVTSLPAREGIRFEDIEWSEALDKAAQEDKLIFVDAYATWCEPCKTMEKFTFTDEEVGAFYNEQFINIRLDMEDFPGVELAEDYQVFTYPSFLFIDGEGTLVHKGCGAMGSSEFLKLGKRALNDKANLIYYQNAYEEQKDDPAFLYEYSRLLDDACMDREGFARAFFEELPRDRWVDEPAWTMINLNVSDPYSPQFQYLMHHHDLFARKYGADTVDQKVFNVLFNQFYEIYNGADLTLFATQALKHLMGQVDFQHKEELKAMVNLQFAELTEDWDLYTRSAVQVVKDQEIVDPDQLNEFAWKIYMFAGDEALLNAAKGWMEQVLADYQDATYLDTYASLHYKLGNTDKAIEWEKKAIRAAESAEEDLVHYQLQLERFQSE